jgi:hypothetical protein
MNNNTKVETAQKSQATNKKTSKVPTGKVTLMKETEARKKAREEQYRSFRINALRRRCKRMKFDDEKTEELVKKLIEQMNAPKEYNIIVMFNSSDYNMVKEAVENAKIKYNILVSGNTKARVSLAYMSLEGNQDVLAKLREIAPASAKIYPYAKKMESVIPKEDREKAKKPTNNTATAKTVAKQKKKELNLHRCKHKKGKGKAVAKQQRKISLSERKKLRKATTVQLNTKKGSKGQKKASTNVKKAA